MKKDIKKQLIKVKDMLERENRHLRENFPITSVKDFKINQRLIETIEKILKNKEK